MSDHHHSADEIKKHVKKYLFVFGALIVGTIITVLVSYYDFGSVGATVAVALLIASVKAFLVAGYFMHLISEKKMIYSILVATVFFFIALMFLTLWSMEPQNLIHIRRNVT